METEMSNSLPSNERSTDSLDPFWDMAPNELLYEQQKRNLSVTIFHLSSSTYLALEAGRWKMKNGNWQIGNDKFVAARSEISAALMAWVRPPVLGEFVTARCLW